MENKETFEKLEIQLRKLDIQRKRIELKKERNTLGEFELRKQAFELESGKLTLDKIGLLSHLLCSHVIDEERTIFGAEPIYKSPLTEEEILTVKERLFNLLRKL